MVSPVHSAPPIQLRPLSSSQNRTTETQFLPFCVPDLGDSELAELTETLRAGWLSTGPKVRQFENEFARFIGTKFAIAVSSGTNAFRLAIRSLCLNEGDDVILSPFAPIVIAEMIRAAGAIPRLADVNESGLQIDPLAVERAITDRTRAIVISHTAGRPAHMDELLPIAQRHQLTLIEDAGSAIPATYQRKRVGGLGDVGCFAFFGQHALSLGDGGMICTNNVAIARTCRALSQDPWRQATSSVETSPQKSPQAFDPSDSWCNFDSPVSSSAAITAAAKRARRASIPGLPKSVDQAQRLSSVHDGYHASMNELNAAIGIAQLRRADTMWQRRREIALSYNINFSRFSELQCPEDRSDSQHAWQSYLLHLNLQRLRITRNEFLEELRVRDIGADMLPTPLHWHSDYAELYGYQPETCPVASQEHAREIALPIYSRMTDADVQRVIEAVEGTVQRFRSVPRKPR